jgi:hypothetical protein
MKPLNETHPSLFNHRNDVNGPLTVAMPMIAEWRVQECTLDKQKVREALLEGARHEVDAWEWEGRHPDIDQTRCYAVLKELGLDKEGDTYWTKN